MTGSVAANFHEGSRSEILADYLFSGWGPVTPVRRQSDFGLDLYCSLSERRGQRAVITDYFVVQVKSTDEPWEFDSADEVNWLVEYPQPLFLAWVDKKDGTIRVYHITPRFLAAFPPRPSRLRLVPTNDEVGQSVPWISGEDISLSAPIITVTLDDLIDIATMDNRRNVFAEWVATDRTNCDLLRRGLFRFRMPSQYRVNESPRSGIIERGYAPTDVRELLTGIFATAEAVECVGGQIGRLGDREAAILAALFVDHLQRHYPKAFDSLMWKHRIPGMLGSLVCDGLNGFLKSRMPNFYYYEGIEFVAAALRDVNVVAAFLAAVDNAAVAQSPQSDLAADGV